MKENEIERVSKIHWKKGNWDIMKILGVFVCVCSVNLAKVETKNTLGECIDYIEGVK